MGLDSVFLTSSQAKSLHPFPALLLAIIIAMPFILFNWHLLRADEIPLFYDAFVNFQRAQELIHQDHGLSILHSLYSPYHHPYPPLFPISLAIISLLTRQPDCVILLTQACFLVLLFFVLMLQGSLLGTRVAGIWAAAMCGIIPTVAGFTRVCMPDFPLAAAVALSYLAIFHWWRAPTVVRSLLLGLSLAFGLLIKQPFVFYILPLLLMILLKTILLSSSRLRGFANILLIALPILILAVPWYSLEAIASLRYIGALKMILPEAKSNSLILFMDLTFQYLTSIPEFLGWPLFLLALAGAVSLGRQHRYNLLLILAGGILLPLPLLAQSFWIVRWRYMVPSTPLWVLLAAAAFPHTSSPSGRQHRFASAFFILLSICQVAVFIQAHRAPPRKDASVLDWNDRNYHTGLLHADKPEIDLELLSSAVGGSIGGMTQPRIQLIPNTTLMELTRCHLILDLNLRTESVMLLFGGSLDNGIYSPSMLSESHWQQEMLLTTVLITYDREPRWQHHRHAEGGIIYQQIILPGLQAVRESLPYRDLVAKIPVSGEDGLNVLVFGPMAPYSSPPAWSVP